jgi:hypothetical protein
VSRAPRGTPDLDGLIEASDLDGLVLAVNRLCDDRDWDGLVSLGARCRAALDRGRQLWPVASHIEYRLALSAPGQWAAPVLVPGAGRFAPGPLPEVAASSHAWGELAPWLSPDAGPLGAVCAHERVVRGEDLADFHDIDGNVFELPLRLEPWEPAYPLATYHADRVETPAPALPAAVTEVSPLAATGGGVRAGVRAAEDEEAPRALLDLARPWTTESDGRAAAVAVQGDTVAALAALGVARARVTELAPADAFALMAWTAASGGAHGRRRGMAAGRFAAWWAVGALGGLLDEWPLPGTVVGELAAGLRWYRWDAGEPETGWVCRLAVEDPAAGLAWALAATDSA